MEDRRTKKQRAEDERAWLAGQAGEIVARLAAVSEADPTYPEIQAEAAENAILIDRADAKLDDYALHPKKGL